MNGLIREIKYSICVVFQSKTELTKQDLTGSCLNYNHVAFKCAQSKHIFAPQKTVSTQTEIYK